MPMQIIDILVPLVTILLVNHCHNLDMLVPLITILLVNRGQNLDMLVPLITILPVKRGHNLDMLVPLMTILPVNGSHNLDMLVPLITILPVNHFQNLKGNPILAMFLGMFTGSSPGFGWSMMVMGIIVVKQEDLLQDLNYLHQTWSLRK